MKKLYSLILLILLITSIAFPQVKIGGKAKIDGKVRIGSSVAAGDFVTDSFTDTSNIDLTAHVGEVGATWTKHPDASYTNFIGIDATVDRIFQDGTAAYYASGVPPSADYYVQADFCNVSTISVNIAICGRMNTSTNTMYCARINNGTSWDMRKLLVGASSTIGTDTDQLPTVGTCKTGKLIFSGSSISFSVNGVVEIGPITDTDISSAGRVGVRGAGTASLTTGFHLDNLSAR